MACVCAHVHEYVHIYAHAGKDQKLIIFIYHSQTYFLTWGLSPVQLDWSSEPQGCSCFCHFSGLVPCALQQCLAFCSSARNLNMGPHAYVLSTLLTELSRQPLCMSFTIFPSSLLPIFISSSLSSEVPGIRSRALAFMQVFY